MTNPVTIFNGDSNSNGMYISLVFHKCLCTTFHNLGTVSNMFIFYEKQSIIIFAFSDVGYASYLVPAAAVGAMGYCYMWWKVLLS